MENSVENCYKLTHKKSQISADVMNQIRKDRMINKFTIKVISERYGYSLTTIWKICKGIDSVSCNINLTDAEREKIVSGIRNMAVAGNTYAEIKREYPTIDSETIESIIKNMIFQDNAYTVPTRNKVKNNNFTEDDVREIRSLYDSGVGVYDIAEKYKHINIQNLTGVIRSIARREMFKKVV